MMASTSDAALKAEIARLTGAINQHKQRPRPFARSTQVPTSTRDVVIDGVTFESSSRSLVRKGLINPTLAPAEVPLKPIPQPTDFSRITHGHRLPTHRSYKPKVSSRPQQRRLRNRNMTLDNTRRPTQGRQPNKRMKYLNKPCPRFTTTGACSRGLTCMYQHDPNKIAICWHFLHGNCPNTAESCNLSHDPIRNVPPSVFILRTTGDVLGRTVRSLTFAWASDMAFVATLRYLDFAEKGTCATKGCKLPHVIRANRNRKVPTATDTTKTGAASSTSENAATASVSTTTSGSDNTSNIATSSQQISVQDAQLGD
ncbi:hypothetical protein JVT61DRAFT_4224 [Boletus reticuloceps]|uniref:C3H1-type domain-containing protein n=1 Tax=Boletus reticuloceps TaxID=495285 RepID=A0A8I2YLQ3_9AGAM|nr:hypothetical protein JVT61DRAFT_4224 [Boletus reticuloceps]